MLHFEWLGRVFVSSWSSSTWSRCQLIRWRTGLPHLEQPMTLPSSSHAAHHLRRCCHAHHVVPA